jgi:hypothetical protein
MALPFHASLNIGNSKATVEWQGWFAFYFTWAKLQGHKES